VLAEVVDIDTGIRTRSNTFHFSFDTAHARRGVRPESYGEAMEYLEGARRVAVGQEMRALYAKEQKKAAMARQG
jgi:acyl-coenzyme A thioesterase 9